MRGMRRNVEPREPFLPDCATNPHAWDRAPNGSPRLRACGSFLCGSWALNENAALCTRPPV